jgi:DNA-binding XRE family transcriptional regulator
MKTFDSYEKKYTETLNENDKIRYNEKVEELKINMMLKSIRKNAGLTQEEVAKRMQRKRPAITRIENHAQDIKLSTIIEYANACGKHLNISFD